MNFILPLALIFFVLALLLLWRAARQQKAMGIPAGRIIYTDTRGWGPVEKPLYEPHLGLTGRPDYLVEQKGQFIPVEVKSTRVSGAPYDAHIFQLAAYCLLVESNYGTRPDYGIIHYPNRTFAVDYTSELELALLDVLEDMRSKDQRKDVQRSHESIARCSRCGYRSLCDQSLH
jgi:CRISPR-associated exonuclease Cas4